jgi:cardiolipin synthase
MAAASSGRAGRDRGAAHGTAPAALSAAAQHAANVLTLGRLVCALPLVILIGAGRYEGAFYVFLVAALSDVLDGYVAKRFSGRTRMGAILDPAADKVLIAAMFLALAAAEAVPLWLALGIVTRDLLIVAGVLLLRQRLMRMRIEPLLIGKICTFVQLLLGGFVLGHLAGIADVASMIELLTVATGAVTLLSALAYLAAALRLGGAPAGTA